MPRERSKSSFVTILILIAAVALWAYDTYQNSGAAKPLERRDSPAEETKHPQATSAESRTGRYDTYRNCSLASDRGNDGDSFRVTLPGGRKEIFRLYFVDSPESAFKTYGGGENNHQRIGEQAQELGRITSGQAVEIGKKAKDFTLSHLSKSTFTIHTEWDSPFNDQRYHAFIELSYNGKQRFLDELLVEKGLARIHTKGAPLPDGTSERKHEEKLFDLQKSAKATKSGAWGY